MALAAQALEAQKARKPLEQGGALEQVGARMKRVMGLTPRLTGAGARSAEGTNTGQKNGEAMASVGVRVEPTVRTRRPQTCLFSPKYNAFELIKYFHIFCDHLC